jgi:D-alanyl-D-alanine-carboxypeptidase/D-alanyl-D-alanine-endopeptidase
VDLAPFDRTLRRVPGIVVGSLAEGHLDVAALGTLSGTADPSALCWEIASITKVFTGILLADLSLSGEVGLDDPIGRHLPDAVAARLPATESQPTLRDLATHTAGLPRIPKAWLWRMRGQDNPYAGLTEQDVWDVLGPRTVRPQRRKMRYSNFGVGLLGHLLARAAGTTYQALIAERVLVPLGLTSTGVGRCGGETEVVQGHRRGKPTPPWTFGALQGAGALRSTAANMLTFAQACIAPSAGPLGEALALAQRPAHTGRFGIARVGLGWQLRAGRPGALLRDTVWHNGGTYGAASFLAVDPSGMAVTAFGNRGPGLVSPLDRPAWKLFDSLSR